MSKKTPKVFPIADFYNLRLAEAFERSRQKAKGITGCTTVAGRTKIRGVQYQVQVVVTMDKDDWCDDETAGVWAD